MTEAIEALEKRRRAMLIYASLFRPRSRFPLPWWVDSAEEIEARILANDPYTFAEEPQAEDVPHLRFATGDILDPAQFSSEGLAIFVMSGLTAFRVLSRDFIKTFGAPIGQNGLYEVYRNDNPQHGRLKWVVYFRNPKNRKVPQEMVNDLFVGAMNLLLAAGCKTIASNAIHSDGASERGTYDAAVLWLRERCRNEVECLTLVDHKGEFSSVIKTKD